MISDNPEYLRVAAATPETKVADIAANVAGIVGMLEQVENLGAALAVFPELCVTGGTCGDLFLRDDFLYRAEDGIRKIADASRRMRLCAVAGVPVGAGGRIYDCAAVISGGKILGLVPKVMACTDIRPWPFASGTDFGNGERGDSVSFAGEDVRIGPNLLFSIGGVTFAVASGEDALLTADSVTDSAVIVANPCAFAETVGETEHRRSALKYSTATRTGALIHCSPGFGESTSSRVFSGAAFICENGTTLAYRPPFGESSRLTVADIDCGLLRFRRRVLCRDAVPAQEYAAFIPAAECDFHAHLYRLPNPTPFVPAPEESDEICRTALEIQATGLLSRMKAIGCRKTILGVSGGLDSTLALLCTARAFDKAGWNRKDIIGVTMPGFGTSGRTRGNASRLMEALGITEREIDIRRACTLHFEDIGHDGVTQDTAYENAQARERTQVLMDIANMENAIVVGTGDLSESALGWCTYNGDQMSHYCVNASIPKTLAREIVARQAAGPYKGSPAEAILLDIVNTPVSPELKGSGKEIEQITEEAIGPYELHDFFIYNAIHNGFSPEKLKFAAGKAFEGRFTSAEISHWVDVFRHRLSASQFKRACSPDGPKVTEVSLHPGDDWNIPSDIGRVALEDMKRD